MWNESVFVMDIQIALTMPMSSTANQMTDQIVVQKTNVATELAFTVCNVAMDARTVPEEMTSMDVLVATTNSSVKMEHAFSARENATVDLTVPTDPMKSTVSYADQTSFNAAQESASMREEDAIVTLTAEMEAMKTIAQHDHHPHHFHPHDLLVAIHISGSVILVNAFRIVLVVTAFLQIVGTIPMSKIALHSVLHPTADQAPPST